MKTKITLALLSTAITLAGVSAVEMTSGTDTMMKDTMVKDTMMKDTMMSASGTMPSTAMTGDHTMMHDAVMAPTHDAGFGSRGEYVSMLQKYLVSKGFLVIPDGVPMGYFGYLTKKAVMSYQESIGVTSTGYFGPKTRMMMQDTMNMSESGSMTNDKMMVK